MAFAKFFCELIIKVVHEQIKIREVEYFDLELEFFLFCELFFVFDCQLLYVRSEFDFYYYKLCVGKYL